MFLEKGRNNSVNPYPVVKDELKVIVIKQMSYKKCLDIMLIYIKPIYIAVDSYCFCLFCKIVKHNNISHRDNFHSSTIVDILHRLILEEKNHELNVTSLKL